MSSPSRPAQSQPALSHVGPDGRARMVDVGDKAVTPSRTITEADIVAFAGLSGDYNEIHTSEQVAQASRFGKRIAHGLLGLSIASGLASTSFSTCPVTLASVTWTKDATGSVLDFADPAVIAQDAGGATNIAWLILYSDTATNKQCIGYQELSTAGTISLVSGSLTLTESASGVLRMTQS